MNSILVEVWYEFKMSSGNITKENFVRKIYPPLSPPDFATNTHACVASVQVSSGSKSEDTNTISHQNVEPIKVQEIRTDDTTAVLQAKGIQQSSRNIVLRASL